MPNAYGKYYAYPVVTQTIGMDGLATHMSGHNTPFSPGAIKGMLTDMVICVRELALQGIAVKIDNLAIFSITKNIEGVKLRARATGELMSDKLNLDATLKKATALTGDGTTDKNSPSTPSGGGTSQGGGSTPSGGGGTSQGGDTPSAGGDNPGGGEGE